VARDRQRARLAAIVLARHVDDHFGAEIAGQQDDGDHQTTIWTGPAHQDANRAKWGSDLPPGVYGAITADTLREPCILVPSLSGGLIAFGADRMDVATRGTRLG
jgi:hypothetical protein